MPGGAGSTPANPHQHPPGEKPSISVMFADPPSVEGIGGGQMVEGALGAAAVELADCDELSSPSPGNSRGTWELGDEALIPPAEEPPTVPPAVVPDGEAAENVEFNDEVGTLRESDPIIVFPPAVVSAAVWAWATVMPRRMIAARIVCCIAFS